MAGDDGFVAYILELLDGLGKVSARKMFGGYGIYAEGAMFALVADDVLYMKVDAENIHVYEEAGQSPFQYLKGDKKVSMSYFTVPDDALDDPDLLMDYASGSLAAAHRARRRR